MSQAIIFDMDGTLFQTDKILKLSLDETFDNLREQNHWQKATPIDVYRNIMGVPLQEVWQTLLPDHSDEIREKANTFFHNVTLQHINNGKGALYAHVKEVLQYFKEHNYLIFIASNAEVDYLQSIVSYYQLNEWITETFSIEQVDSSDKKDLVLKILDKYPITQGLMVGDRLTDIQAGKGNGLTSIGCRFDFAREEELAQADFVINDLREIKEVVTNIEKQINL